MKFYIKKDKWEDFERNHIKYGFKDLFGRYMRSATNNRVLFVYADREVADCKFDSTTKTGYAYEGEFRHRTKTYIMDLIADGYIEIRME